MSSDQRIPVSDDMWRRLNRRKEPGDTFDDVLDREIERKDELEERIEYLERRINELEAQNVADDGGATAEK